MAVVEEQLDLTVDEGTMAVVIYRDPESGAVVVADYKTDRIEDRGDLEGRRAQYARQGAGYVRAVQEALALEAPPRFELWFLDADRIEDAGDGPA